MYPYDSHPIAEPWHSPERAWAPVLWLIRVVAIALAMVLFVPLLQLVLLA